MLRVVLFDFDYTLGDSTDGIVESVNYGLEKLGYPKQSRALIRKTIGLSLKECFYMLIPRGSEQEANAFCDYFVKKADEVMVANTILYDGALEVLRQLRNAGCQIGIVTTKYSYRIRDIFNKFQAEELLDLIVGGDDVNEKKPSPEGIFLALEKLNCKGEEILYVGDSLVDAKTAENASVDFAAVLTGTTLKEEFAPYPHVFIGNDVHDVYGYITTLL